MDNFVCLEEAARILAVDLQSVREWCMWGWMNSLWKDAVWSFLSRLLLVTSADKRP